MIVELVKETSKRNPFFSAYSIRGGYREKICVLTDCIERNEQIIRYNFADRTETLYFSLTSQKGKELQKGINVLQRPTTYFILDNTDAQIGKIYIKSNKLKNHLLITYYSIIFEYCDNKYEVWEIGFGSEGQYYVIYDDNDELIAVMEHIDAKNYGDAVYRLYTTKDDAIELIFLASYWYLNKDYCYICQDHETSPFAMITPYKEIKSKYDPDFIMLIKAMDGIID